MSTQGQEDRFEVMDNGKIVLDRKTNVRYYSEEMPLVGKAPKVLSALRELTEACTGARIGVRGITGLRMNGQLAAAHHKAQKVIAELLRTR